MLLYVSSVVLNVATGLLAAVGVLYWTPVV